MSEGALLNFLPITVLFFLLGFASLLLEVTWSRQTGLLFGHTVQGSAILLAPYFGGMTAGYLLGEGEVFRRFESAYGWIDVLKTDEDGLKLTQNIH